MVATSKYKKLKPPKCTIPTLLRLMVSIFRKKKPLTPSRLLKKYLFPMKPTQRSFLISFIAPLHHHSLLYHVIPEIRRFFKCLNVKAIISHLVKFHTYLKNQFRNIDYLYILPENTPAAII